MTRRHASRVRHPQLSRGLATVLLTCTLAAALVLAAKSSRADTRAATDSLGQREEGGDPRLLARLDGCGGEIVTFSRDGSKILTGDSTRVRVWDAHTFKPVNDPIPAAGGRLVTAEFSPDGSRVLVCGRTEAAVYKTAGGVPVARLRH